MGSYVTLMQLGTNPDLWRCGVAGIPVGDYEAGYEDLSPPLKAYDRALLGGRPDEVPELMAFANPINHADHVRAPVLFVIGENDSRCPLRQAMAYVDRLAARGHPHTVHRFGTGHGSNERTKSCCRCASSSTSSRRTSPDCATSEPAPPTPWTARPMSRGSARLQKLFVGVLPSH